jgi:hypothetical protein
MEKQEKVQTFYESLHIMFDAEIRVNFDYNKITRSTPFIHRSASVFTEGDCRHFQSRRYGDKRLNNWNIEKTILSEWRIEI